MAAGAGAPARGAGWPHCSPSMNCLIHPPPCSRHLGRRRGGFPCEICGDRHLQGRGILRPGPDRGHVKGTNNEWKSVGVTLATGRGRLCRPRAALAGGLFGPVRCMSLSASLNSLIVSPLGLSPSLHPPCRCGAAGACSAPTGSWQRGCSRRCGSGCGGAAGQKTKLPSPCCTSRLVDVWAVQCPSSSLQCRTLKGRCDAGDAMPQKPLPPLLLHAVPHFRVTVRGEF